jgi:flagellar biosynthesis protein FlhA
VRSAGGQRGHGSARLPLQGEEPRELAFGLKALWISDNDRQRAELAGYTVVDAPGVLITYLGEVVRRHAHEVLSREDLKAMVAEGV